MKLQNKTTTRLGGYLTAAVSCGTLASTASAAIVTLDVSSFDGPNAGLPSAYGRSDLFLLPGNLINFYTNEPRGIFGVAATWTGPLNLAMNATTYGSGLFKFSSGQEIGSAENWNSDSDGSTYFRYFDNTQPAWGSNSFIGFQANSNTAPLYGWLEVTWNPTTDTFEFLRGAYEDSGASIFTPVPEPSTAMLSLGALAAGAFLRRRKQAA